MVGNQVVKLVQNFFNFGIDLYSINEIGLVLISKINNSELAYHFRPIGLCNFRYKVISKVMTNRMKHIFPKIIFENQRAFVLGRLIQDNILIGFSLLEV